jgi:hypothetical protein
MLLCARGGVIALIVENAGTIIIIACSGVKATAGFLNTSLLT